MNIGEGISGAAFSEDGSQRFALWRVWGRTEGSLLFTGLNPSKAGHIKNDPTVVRMVNFAKLWGFSGLFVSNLFSQVTPYPDELVAGPGGDPIQEAFFALNDVALVKMRKLCKAAVVGWGEFGKRYPTRVADVLKLIGEPVYCIKVNPSGEPSHPLYLPGKSKLIRYYRKGACHE